MIRWALSVIRARALRDRLLLSATAVMVLISTTLLAAGPVTILVATHDPTLLDVAHRVLDMTDGRLHN